MRQVLFLFVWMLVVLACGDDALDPSGDADSERSGADGGDAAPTTLTPLDGGADLDASARAPKLLDARIHAPGADGGTGAGPLGEVPCIDEQIAQLMLFEAPNPGAITEEGTQPGVFQTHIDATAGGLTSTLSFVYARFGAQGLERVELGDEDAFASSDWHVALRRYVIRINSGVSGPGSVRAARTAPGTTFDQLSSVPSDLIYRIEEYFTSSCEYVPDTSGVGAPASALSSFWSYSSCLAMTHNVYVIELPGARHVKLEVTGYYPPENQTRCDETDMISTPSGAGNLRIKWAFLD